MSSAPRDRQPQPDIVDSREFATQSNRTPLLVLDDIRDYLDEREIGSGRVRAERIGNGSSNITFLLERGDQRFVLRRPPRPPFAHSAHDVVREASLQQALSTLGFSVPTVLSICDDASVLGVPFYLMEYIEGDVVTTTLPLALATSEKHRRAVIEDLVAALARLHAIDASQPELRAFVRPGNYLVRQLKRFGSLWDGHEGRDIPQIDEARTWLERTVPAETKNAVVHGDFRLGNVMLSRAGQPRVAAILDWEMGAIGDPRSDLGYLIATYSDAASLKTPLELSPVTALPGFPTAYELVELYEEMTGSHVGDLPWFRAFALWKGAIFCEAIHQRFLRGEMPDDPFAAVLGTGVIALGSAACQVAATGSY